MQKIFGIHIAKNFNIPKLHNRNLILKFFSNEDNQGETEKGNKSDILTELNSIHNMADLFKYFNENHKQFEMIHNLIFLRNLSNTMRVKNVGIYVKYSDFPEFKNLLKYLSEHYKKMNYYGTPNRLIQICWTLFISLGN